LFCKSTAVRRNLVQRFAAYFIASSTATGRLKKAFINAVFFSVVYYECISYEGAWRLCVFVAVKNGVKKPKAGTMLKRIQLNLY